MEPETSPQAESLEIPVEVSAAAPVLPGPSDESQISLSLKDLKALISGAVQEAVAPLIQKNQALQEQAQRSSSMEYADGVPAHLRRGDPNVDPNRMSVAMSVTIPTRPVQENPEQYKNVVDMGSIYANDAMKRIPGDGNGTD